MISNEDTIGGTIPQYGGEGKRIIYIGIHFYITLFHFATDVFDLVYTAIKLLPTLSEI